MHETRWAHQAIWIERGIGETRRHVGSNRVGLVGVRWRGRVAIELGPSQLIGPRVMNGIEPRQQIALIAHNCRDYTEIDDVLHKGLAFPSQEKRWLESSTLSSSIG